VGGGARHVFLPRPSEVAVARAEAHLERPYFDHAGCYSYPLPADLHHDCGRPGIGASRARVAGRSAVAARPELARLRARAALAGPLPEHRATSQRPVPRRAGRAVERRDCQPHARHRRESGGRGRQVLPRRLHDVLPLPRRRAHPAAGARRAATGAGRGAVDSRADGRGFNGERLRRAGDRGDSGDSGRAGVLGAGAAVAAAVGCGDGAPLNDPDARLVRRLGSGCDLPRGDGALGQGRRARGLGRGGHRLHGQRAQAQAYRSSACSACCSAPSSSPSPSRCSKSSASQPTPTRRPNSAARPSSSSRTRFAMSGEERSGFGITATGSEPRSPKPERLLLRLAAHRVAFVALLARAGRRHADLRGHVAGHLVVLVQRGERLLGEGLHLGVTG
jgi:hypothetical protein